jgi:hypothetical protein
MRNENKVREVLQNLINAFFEDKNDEMNRYFVLGETKDLKDMDYDELMVALRSAYKLYLEEEGEMPGPQAVEFHEAGKLLETSWS